MTGFRHPCSRGQCAPLVTGSRFSNSIFEPTRTRAPGLAWLKWKFRCRRVHADPEPVPGQSIRYTDQLEDPNPPGEQQVTLAFKPVFCGIEVSIEQAVIAGASPLEMCYLS